MYNCRWFGCVYRRLLWWMTIKLKRSHGFSTWIKLFIYLFYVRYSSISGDVYFYQSLSDCNLNWNCCCVMPNVVWNTEKKAISVKYRARELGKLALQTADEVFFFYVHFVSVERVGCDGRKRLQVSFVSKWNNKWNLRSVTQKDCTAEVLYFSESSKGTVQLHLF